MADDLSKEEPPVKRLKLQENTTTTQKSITLTSTTNTSLENTTNYSNEVPSCSKDQTDEENKDFGRQTEVDKDDSDNVSEISNLSGLSEESWKPTSGALSWIQKQIMSGVNPRPILQGLIPDETLIPHDLDDFTLWKIVINIMSEPPSRKKLSHINTFNDVIQLLQTCQNIMVLTGAGVSVSCGIPDFRSRDGIYARLAVDFPDLPDPQAMFDINYFKNDPRPFFKFAKEIYPGQFEPSASHKFISTIEKRGKLLRNYTQNIDTLEQVAGIGRVIQCHGSFASATCMVCKHKVDAEAVREDIFNQVIPKCPICPVDNPESVMKPDIVFFGESLSDEFHKQMTIDKDKCDLLIVIGSSLKVRPVALIPNSLPENVPQILINREPLRHLNFDVELLGNCDDIVEEICKHLNWDEKSRSPILHEISKSDLRTPTQSELGESEENNINVNECQSSNEKLDTLNHSNINSGLHSTEPSESVKSSSIGDFKSERVNGHETNKTSDKQNSYNKSNNEKQETINLNKNFEHASSKNHPCCIIEKKCEGKDTNMIDEDFVYSIEVNKNKNCDKHKHEAASKTSEMTKDSEKSELNGEDEGTEEDDDLEVIRSMWKPRHCSLAKRLGEKQYLFIPPNRYVFSGAEVYSDMEQDSDSECDSHSSYSSLTDDEMDLTANGEEKNESDSDLGGKGDSCKLTDIDITKSCGQDLKADTNGINQETLVLTNSGEGTFHQTKSDTITKTSASSVITLNGHKPISGMHQDYDGLDNLDSINDNCNPEYLKDSI